MAVSCRFCNLQMKGSDSKVEKKKCAIRMLLHVGLATVCSSFREAITINITQGRNRSIDVKICEF